MVNASYADNKKIADMGQRLANKSVLWWLSKNTKQAGFVEVQCRAVRALFNEVIDWPVLIDMRTINALKHSPMALDIYTWLTYLASHLKRPTSIHWAILAMQFGSDYSRLRDFLKHAFIDELKKSSLVYGQVRAEVADLGLMAKPSMTQIRNSTP